MPVPPTAPAGGVLSPRFPRQVALSGSGTQLRRDVKTRVLQPRFLRLCCGDRRARRGRGEGDAHAQNASRRGAALSQAVIFKTTRSPRPQS